MGAGGGANSFFASGCGAGAAEGGGTFSSIGAAFCGSTPAGFAASSATFFLGAGFLTCPSFIASASCAFLMLIFKFLANS